MSGVNANANLNSGQIAANITTTFQGAESTKVIQLSQEAQTDALQKDGITQAEQEDLLAQATQDLNNPNLPPGDKAKLIAFIELISQVPIQSMNAPGGVITSSTTPPTAEQAAISQAMGSSDEKTVENALFQALGIPNTTPPTPQSQIDAIKKLAQQIADANQTPPVYANDATDDQKSAIDQLVLDLTSTDGGPIGDDLKNLYDLNAGAQGVTPDPSLEQALTGGGQTIGNSNMALMNWQNYIFTLTGQGSSSQVQTQQPDIPDNVPVTHMQDLSDLNSSKQDVVFHALCDLLGVDPKSDDGQDLEEIAQQLAQNNEEGGPGNPQLQSDDPAAITAYLQSLYPKDSPDQEHVKSMLSSLGETIVQTASGGRAIHAGLLSSDPDQVKAALIAMATQNLQSGETLTPQQIAALSSMAAHIASANASGTGIPGLDSDNSDDVTRALQSLFSGDDGAVSSLIPGLASYIATVNGAPLTFAPAVQPLSDSELENLSGLSSTDAGSGTNPAKGTVLAALLSLSGIANPTADQLAALQELANNIATQNQSGTLNSVLDPKNGSSAEDILTVLEGMCSTSGNANVAPMLATLSDHIQGLNVAYMNNVNANLAISGASAVSASSDILLPAPPDGLNPYLQPSIMAILAPMLAVMLVIMNEIVSQSAKLDINMQKLRLDMAHAAYQFSIAAGQAEQQSLIDQANELENNAIAELTQAVMGLSTAVISASAASSAAGKAGDEAYTSAYNNKLRELGKDPINGFDSTSEFMYTRQPVPGQPGKFQDVDVLDSSGNKVRNDNWISPRDKATAEAAGNAARTTPASLARQEWSTMINNIGQNFNNIVSSWKDMMNAGLKMDEAHQAMLKAIFQGVAQEISSLMSNIDSTQSKADDAGKAAVQFLESLYQLFKELAQAASQLKG